MKYYIKTFGCKLNQCETDQLESEFNKRGFMKTSLEQNADIIVINTCTVTSTADAKARQFVSKALRARQKSNKVQIFVTGCGVNNKNSGLNNISDIKIIQQEDKLMIAEQLAPLVNGRNKGSNKSKGRSRVLLKIQDGCDHQCSYCIVPSVRGSSKSVSVNEILLQARKLVEDGFQEIVLTGVDIGDYHHEEYSLEDLVREILAIDNKFRLRLSSLEPQSISDSFIRLFMNEERICNHIHLPLQSGSDSILAAMNRPYTVKQINNLAQKIKRRKDLALTSDVIVGFPGENDDDFKQTLKVVQDIGFSKLHIFRYSEREPMSSTKIKPKIDERIKKERARQLNDLAKKMQINYLKGLVGKNLQVLIERKQGKYFKGTSSNYCPVFVEGSPKKGSLVNVKVNCFNEGLLFGKLSKEVIG